MGGARSNFPITLAAALRDVSSDNVVARNIAVRHLGGLLVDAVSRGAAPPQSSIWRAYEHHPRGLEVRDALRRCAREDGDAGLRALAATGLAQIGDDAVIAIVEPWIARTEEDVDASFQRECGLIALTLVGAALRDTRRDPDGVRDIARRLAAALDAESPDARYQAAQGLVELLGARAEHDLVRALRNEQDARVRAGIALALSELDPPGPEALAALRPLVVDREIDRGTAYAAALALASARDPAGGELLLTAVADRSQRERALEALAVLGERAPAATAARVRRLAESWLTAPVTRVRAAYVLARIERAAGEQLLQRFERSLLRRVREAAADARAGLRRLDAET